MTLSEVVDQYIAWRQARGAHFRSGASIVRRYCQSVGSEIDCDAVGTEPARVFLAGNGPLTRYRANKRTVLAGFYRYAISRGHTTHSPLPADEPKEPSSSLELGLNRRFGRSSQAWPTRNGGSTAARIARSWATWTGRSASSWMRCASRG